MKTFKDYLQEAKLVSNKDGRQTTRQTSYASSEPNSYKIIDKDGNHIGSASQAKDPKYNFKTTHWVVSWHGEHDGKHPSSFQYIKQLKDHLVKISD
jgi:hypothetical protein